MTDSGSRLVATTRTPGAALRTSATSSAAASSRCSQLSTTSSSFRSRRWASRRARGSVAAWSRRSRRREDRVVDQAGVPDVGELDQPCAVREGSREIGPDSDREAGLADAARADEGDQANRGELLPQLRELAAAADEAGRLGRQVAPATGGPGHGDKHGTPAVGGPWPARSRPDHEPHRCRRAPPRRRLACMTDATRRPRDRRRTR